jgi:hypothetical protein
VIASVLALGAAGAAIVLVVLRAALKRAREEKNP